MKYFAQFIPPLFLIAVISRHGPGFWFLLWIPTIAVLISSISLLIKLFKSRTMRLVLIRPSLTIVIGMLVLTLALSSYSRAKKEACHLALKIHATCVKDMQCPESLDGTGVEVGKLSGKPVVGGWVKYPFQYRLTKQGFIGYVYQSLDMGGNIVGNYTGELSWESGKHCVGI